MKNTETKIKELILHVIENDLSIEQLHTDSNLVELGINSLTFVKLTIEIEKVFEFEFEIENLDMGNFITIKSLIDYVQRKAIEQ